jgi:hypothetical protein
MGGYIRKREVLRHPILIIRSFGWRVFVRCLRADRDTTFLSVLSACDRI